MSMKKMEQTITRNAGVIMEMIFLQLDSYINRPHKRIYRKIRQKNVKEGQILLPHSQYSNQFFEPKPKPKQKHAPYFQSIDLPLTVSCEIMQNYGCLIIFMSCENNIGWPCYCVKSLNIKDIYVCHFMPLKCNLHKIYSQTFITFSVLQCERVLSQIHQK